MVSNRTTFDFPTNLQTFCCVLYKVVFLQFSILVDYDAFIDETRTGHVCKSWADMPTQRYGFPKDGTSHSYCRSTEDLDKGAWCWWGSGDTDWEYCKCPDSYTGSWIGQDFTDESVDDGTFSVSDDTPSCPSDKCWIYNSSNKQCDLTADCSTLTCSGKSMTISMSIDVLGPSTGFTGISPTPIENENGEFVITCELGKCGMNYYTDNDKLVPYIIVVIFLFIYSNN